MTDEQWSYRNRSNFSWSGYDDVNHLFHYRGYDVPVPYNLQTNPLFSKERRAWQDKVKEAIDRKVVDGKLYSNDSQGEWYDFIPPLASEIYNTVKPYAQAGLDKVRNFLGMSDSGNSYTSGSGSASSLNTSESASPFDSYLTYLNGLKEINEANNAFNVEQAQKQMDFQREQNKIFMDFNALEAQKSRDWQTEMSNTAYQRQVADMMAAGLNPVLAASGGNGASIGSGTAAQASGAASGSKATADNLYGSAMLSMMNSAMNIAEKSASAAITANAVAARGISSDSGWNLKNILSGMKDFASVVKIFKQIF